MARYFFDTSALVKHYHAEAGTDVVDGVRQSLDQKVGLSPVDPAFWQQSDEELQSSEPVPS